MKTILVLLLLTGGLQLTAQITVPAIRANVTVDAHLKSNSFNGVSNAGSDDWFSDGAAGSGQFIIDTTGASFIKKMYSTNPSSRMMPLFRGMRYPQFSVVNNNLLIDAVFIRDHHGDDSTVFASGSNKNGMSPASWTCPSSQGVPDKNDILDMFMHVRRNGPNTSDSLWLFGGVSLEGTGGNRYFDFEMYQTDIHYERATLSFKGFGPDAGHTSWKFDAAGNVIQAGDIIFTAEYDNSSLSLVEARIWVHNSALSTTPNDFNWGGDFVGANSGSSFGYANITPNTSGTFYTGIQNSVNTWGGPFSVVRANNSIVTDYTPKQFMEFSVNLSKLGLDPLVNIGDPCKMPFRRILVKSRASTSFSAELKDFVGPFDFFRAPMASANADIPFFCGTGGISNIAVSNPIITSLYTWTTSNGHIVGDSLGPSINVDKEGTYIVSQQLMDSCGTSYAKDTVTITRDAACVILSPGIQALRGIMNGTAVQLKWKLTNPQSVLDWVMERSLDGKKFTTVFHLALPDQNSATNYFVHTDYLQTPASDGVFYRIRYKDANGMTRYSVSTLVYPSTENGRMRLAKNPVSRGSELQILGVGQATTQLIIRNSSGSIVHISTTKSGSNMILLPLSTSTAWSKGIYFVTAESEGKRWVEKFILE